MALRRSAGALDAPRTNAKLWLEYSYALVSKACFGASVSRDTQDIPMMRFPKASQRQRPFTAVANQATNSGAKSHESFQSLYLIRKDSYSVHHAPRSHHVTPTGPRRSPHLHGTRGFTATPSASIYIHRERPHDCPSLKEPIIVDEQMGVAMISLNRPDQLNALNFELMRSLMAHLKRLDAEPSIKVMVIKGNGRAFAAGADIKELSQVKSYSQAREMQLLENWNDMLSVRKPIIAAVHGPCLGGGCELAMACDIVFAAESARFGLPEVTLGLIPGGGGTQRLTRRVGKARAMEMILTGQTLTAYEADRYGLVSTVVPDEHLVDRAYDKAQSMVVMSSPVLQKAKECVNAAQEMPLEEGLLFEKREFWSCFALEDPAEGMAAFFEKRRPHFKHK